MDRGPQRSSRPKRFGRIDPFAWIPVVSLITIAALMIVSGAAPIGAGLAVFALLLLLFDSWVNRPDPEAAPARRPLPEGRARPPREQPRTSPPPPPARNRPAPRQQPPRMDSRPVPRQAPPPPPRRPGPRSGAGA